MVPLEKLHDFYQCNSALFSGDLSGRCPDLDLHCQVSDEKDIDREQNTVNKRLTEGYYHASISFVKRGSRGSSDRSITRNWNTEGILES